ncbi:MAG: leucine-rich repeat protein [Spirochaetales bacterium]|nr:leucine-rich repeat protein [Spirochaetales bacterium]
MKASLVDDGNYGFVLRIEGSGDVAGFASPDEAPWYKVSGRITAIEIPEGITGIGDNCFPACVYLKSVVLPGSVVKVGRNSFSGSTAVCAYGAVDAPEGQKIYMYSDEKPADGALHWRLKDGKVDLWNLTKVLFIGNSFTYYNDMDQTVARIARDAGWNVVVTRITIGSHNLSQFADPADEGGRQVLEALEGADDFDFVVLQEQSTRPLNNPNLFGSGVSSLVSLVRKTQKDCRVLLYQTWGFPAGVSGSTTVEQMEQNLYNAYSKVATELGLGLSPVGRAFSKVRAEHPEIELYNPDGRHPSPEGSYLAACVHAAVIFGLDPRGLAAGTVAHSDVLSGTAYEIVFK